MSNSPATDGRHLSAAAKEALRLRAVRAVRVEGMKQADVVRTLGVGKTSLYEWLCAYDSGGEAALAAQAVGRRPGHTRLNNPIVSRCWKITVMIKIRIFSRHPNAVGG